MSQSKGPYGRMTHQVLAFLRTHPGVCFTAADVAQQLGCPTTQARMALEGLAQDGVIDREQPEYDVDYYVYPPREPPRPD